MPFKQLQLCEPILRAVAGQGYQIPTDIQSQAIPHVLAGRDVLGCAQTGTGKTAAFALPILHRLSQAATGKGGAIRPRCLVLCPTRELATQISEGFDTYGAKLKLRGAVIFGGVNQRPQVAKLRRGLDLLIATPGRLMDLMNQGHVDLGGIETLVLDEADRMLDMGFIHDIRRIVAKVPAARQTLLFSATMPKEIRALADTLLRDPVTVEVAAETVTVDKVQQSVYFVERTEKPDCLARLMDELGMYRVIVFTRTKHGADRLVRQLDKRRIKALAIHGNKTQNARQRALENFRNGKVAVLVATDIAARGIDVDDVSHVVNYDLTHEPETYVHRIGRTARAGASGEAVSLCGSDERVNLKAIERLLGREIPVRKLTGSLTDCPARVVREPQAQQNTKGKPSRSENRPGRKQPKRRQKSAQAAAKSNSGENNLGDQAGAGNRSRSRRPRQRRRS